MISTLQEIDKTGKYADPTLARRKKSKEAWLTPVPRHSTYPYDTRVEETDTDTGIPENLMKSTISAWSLGSKSKANKV